MISMAKKNAEPEKVIVYTVEVGHGYTGLNVREKPSTASMVLYVAPNGSMVKPDDTIVAPEGWIAVQGGGFVLKEYLR